MTARRAPRPYSGDPSRRGGRSLPRDVLMQCERGGASGTARVRRLNGRPRLTFAGVVLRRPATHPDCGGSFRLFDLSGAA